MAISSLRETATIDFIFRAGPTERKKERREEEKGREN